MQGFSKIAGPLTLLRTTNLTCLSPISQSLINAVDENKVDESGDVETNLSNLSTSRIFTRAGYLTSKDAKKGVDNPKKGGSNTKINVKTTRGSDFLIPDAKKTSNHLWHAFT